MVMSCLLFASNVLLPVLSHNLFHQAHGVPLACDATMLSPLHADGTPWPYAAVRDGVALERERGDDI